MQFVHRKILVSGQNRQFAAAGYGAYQKICVAALYAFATTGVEKLRGKLVIQLAQCNILKSTQGFAEGLKLACRLDATQQFLPNGTNHGGTAVCHQVLQHRYRPSSH